ncbi:DUF221-domain-containing protein [Favolaschia claudopus]|uniref:DUF221-domain-containing protein n=1 Tax=Favolaschia claudopus TaxID=2862362 RepID=A0AAW0DXH9_9AGAR
MGFDPQAAANAFNAGRTFAPQAVGTQVVLMSVISFVTLILFNLLRPRNKIVYEPKVKYHEGDKPPPRIGDSFCGWLPPLLHTREPELLDKIGLDAVAFLRFLRLMGQTFAGIAILTCCILIPINYRYNQAKVNPKKRDALSSLTIRDVKGNTIYYHVAVSYLITILVIGLVYIHGRAMVELRNQWFKSPEYIKSFYARTLSITNVPKKLQQDVGLMEILPKTLPYPISSFHIARTVGDLPQLIEYHNETVREFEAVLVKFLKSKNATSRPVVIRGAFCGIGGVRHDAIDFYTQKLKNTETAVEEYRARIDSRKPENYGFASLASVPYAHIVAKKLAGKHPKGATITLAPNPKDIIWSNMTKSKRSLGCKRLIGFGWLSVICFFSLIPLFFVAALANLDGVAAAGYLPFLDDLLGDSEISFAIITGVIPPVVSGLFTLFLPRIMRWLGKYQGALTHASLDRGVVARYFAFLVISQLIVFTLIGVVFNSVTEIVELIGKGASSKTILANVDKLPGKIPRTYINTSTFWLKFFPLRGFLVVFDLAQIIKLVWVSIKTRLFGRTPRDIREWTKPPKFEYAIYYSNLLFMGVVGLIFAPLVPLVALAAAVVFWISIWVYKYQLMFVFVTKVETGGRLWNVVINRVLFSLFLMQCLMILTIGLQISFRSVKMVIAVPPILMIICFKIYMNRKFNENFYYYLPDEEELRTVQVHSTRSDTVKQKLLHRFGHPSLHAELFTPMVHADQMMRLRQVYNGKVEETTDKTRAATANVEVLGGLRIAAIQQSDLQYDPVQYSRDRGEYDYDRYSLASSTMLSPSIATPTLSVYKGNIDTPASLQYNRQSYLGSEMDNGMLSPQSIGSSTLDATGFRQSLSPPPQSYFDVRPMAPVAQPLHPQTPPTPSRPLSAASFQGPGYPGYGGPPVMPRPMSASSPSQMAVRPPSSTYENHHHHSMSVYSQDSGSRTSPLPPPQPPASSHQPRPSRYSSQSPSLSMHGDPGRSYTPPVAPLAPQRTPSGWEPHAQEWSPESLITEEPRHPAQPSVVFQFGAPERPDTPRVASSSAPAFPDAQVPFVEPRFEQQQ